MRRALLIRGTRVKDDGLNRLIPNIEELARGMGDTLISAELVREHGGVTLRLTIDKQGGTMGASLLSLSDCEAFHRAIIPVVDAIPYDTLEVESPGADRVLSSDADLNAAIGLEIDIRLYRIAHGAKRHHGLLTCVTDESVTILKPNGSIPADAAASQSGERVAFLPVVLPRGAIAQTRLYVSMEPHAMAADDGKHNDSDETNNPANPGDPSDPADPTDIDNNAGPREDARNNFSQNTKVQ